MGNYKSTLLDPLIDNNPITFHILGICSALAVTSRLETSIVMSIAVIFVLSMSNFSISLIRNHMPGSIRILIEMTIIASLTNQTSTSRNGQYCRKGIYILIAKQRVEKILT